MKKNGKTSDLPPYQPVTQFSSRRLILGEQHHRIANFFDNTLVPLKAEFPGQTHRLAIAVLNSFATVSIFVIF